MAKKLLTKKQKRQFVYALLSFILAGFVWLGQKQGWLEQPLVEKDVSQTNDTINKETLKPDEAVVVSVVDGDTIKVAINGQKETVRLIGVDTPETRDPRKPVQCFGDAASNFTKNLVSDKKVRLESDSKSSNRDRYDRILRYVYLQDNTLVNIEIISQGYGFAYTSFEFDKINEFKLAEKQAREGNLGLWGSCPST